MNQSKRQIAKSQAARMKSGNTQGSTLDSLTEARLCLSEHLEMPARNSDILDLIGLNVLANLAEHLPDIILLADEIQSYGALGEFEASDPTMIMMLGFVRRQII